MDSLLSLFYLQQSMTLEKTIRSKSITVDFYPSIGATSSIDAYGISNKESKSYEE